MMPRRTTSKIEAQQTSTLQKPSASRATIAKASGLVLLIALGVSGCSVTRGTRKPDGQLSVWNARLLWKSEAICFEVLSTNFNARLIIGKSASDDASVGAITEGAVKGATRL